MDTWEEPLAWPMSRLACLLASRTVPISLSCWCTCRNSFQSTLTPNPEKLYKYSSVAKQGETCFWMCSLNAFKFRCRWFGNRSLPLHPPRFSSAKHLRHLILYAQCTLSVDSRPMSPTSILRLLTCYSSASNNADYFAEAEQTLLIAEFWGCTINLCSLCIKFAWT